MDLIFRLKITAEMFFRVLRDNSEVALDVIRMLSNKITNTHEQYEAKQAQLTDTLKELEALQEQVKQQAGE